MDKVLLYIALILFFASMASWLASRYLDSKKKYTLSIVMIWVQVLCFIFAIASVFIYKNF